MEKITVMQMEMATMVAPMATTTEMATTETAMETLTVIAMELAIIEWLDKIV